MLPPDLLRVPAGAGNLHVARWGHASRHVVLIHGFGTCGFLWRHVGPALALGRHMAFAIDLLGHGESDRPLEADYGIAAQAEALDRALGVLRISKAVLVGLDMGAAVALRLAATRPERVERLVLVNPYTAEETPSDDVAAMPADAAKFALRLQGLLGAAPLIEELIARQAPEGRPAPQGLIARYLAPFAGRDGPKHLLTLAAALRPEDLSDLQLDRVEAPALILHGALERWLDPENARALAAALPQARLEVIPDVGRLIPEEAPALLAERILAFARERRTPRLAGRAPRPSTARPSVAPSSPPRPSTQLRPVTRRD